jgi:tRNA nucleotidyltransferase (CCA-adding enzyme)
MYVSLMAFNFSTKRTICLALQKHYQNLHALALETPQEDQFQDETAPNVEKMRERMSSAVTELKTSLLEEGYSVDPPSAFPATKKRANNVSCSILPF